MTLRDGAATFSLAADRAEAATPWCRAVIGLRLGPEELPRLAEGLRGLAAAGSGSLLWANEGGEVRIEVAMAKRGETHWSVRLQTAPDFLHEVRLVFVGRQEELAELAEGLQRPLTPAPLPQRGEGF